MKGLPTVVSADEVISVVFVVQDVANAVQQVAAISVLIAYFIWTIVIVGDKGSINRRQYVSSSAIFLRL